MNERKVDTPESQTGIRVTLATGEVLRYSGGWSVVGLFEDVQRRYPGAKMTVEMEDDPAPAPPTRRGT